MFYVQYTGWKNCSLCTLGVTQICCFLAKNYPQIRYSVSNKALKNLIVLSKIKGNFSTHSLRRGGTTSMRAAGVPLGHIKKD